VCVQKGLRVGLERARFGVVIRGNPRTKIIFSNNPGIRNTAFAPTLRHAQWESCHPPPSSILEPEPHGVQQEIKRSFIPSHEESAVRDGTSATTMAMRTMEG